MPEPRPFRYGKWGAIPRRAALLGRAYVRGDGFFVEAKQENPGEPARWVAFEDEGQGRRREVTDMAVTDRHRHPMELFGEVDRLHPYEGKVGPASTPKPDPVDPKVAEAQAWLPETD